MRRAPLTALVHGGRSGPNSQNLGCDAVIGYTELTTVHDAVAVFTAIGTAAVRRAPPLPPFSSGLRTLHSSP